MRIFSRSAFSRSASERLQYLHNGEVWQTDQRFFEPWYQSAVAYTTLGDETPEHASVRLLISVEALTGLILITWTASFLFLVMQRPGRRSTSTGATRRKKRSKTRPAPESRNRRGGQSRRLIF